MRLRSRRKLRRGKLETLATQGSRDNPDRRGRPGAWAGPETWANQDRCSQDRRETWTNRGRCDQGSPETCASQRSRIREMCRNQAPVKK